MQHVDEVHRRIMTKCERHHCKLTTTRHPLSCRSLQLDLTTSTNLCGAHRTAPHRPARNHVARIAPTVTLFDGHKRIQREATPLNLMKRRTLTSRGLDEPRQTTHTMPSTVTTVAI